MSRTLVTSVIEKGVSTFAYDAINDERFSSGRSVLGQQVRSVMCVPLRTSDAILGALYVDSLSAAGRFSEADLELMAALGNQAGVALHRVRLMGELERLLLDTIRAIAATIDAKDGYTHRHSERVAALARRIALEIGLTADEQQTAELSALLHDVGKIAVPDSILNKPGRLTEAEFDEMKKHPLHGARIVSNIQSPAVTAVLPGVQYHHERWDGSGYPEGLRGEQIPLLGRLLGVADFYDALTSDPSVSRAVSATRKRSPCSAKSSGSHFDAGIVEAVLRLHERDDLLPTGWEDLLPMRGHAVLSPTGPGAFRAGRPGSGRPWSCPTRVGRIPTPDPEVVLVAASCPHATARRGQPPFDSITCTSESGDPADPWPKVIRAAGGTTCHRAGAWTGVRLDDVYVLFDRSGEPTHGTPVPPRCSPVGGALARREPASVRRHRGKSAAAAAFRRSRSCGVRRRRREGHRTDAARGGDRADSETGESVFYRADGC